MKYFKTFGLALFQAFMFLVLEYGMLYLYIRNIVDENSAAIGIIGGADGPTAIFTSTGLTYEFAGLLYFLVMLVICFIGNLSALIKENKKLSVVIISLCCLLACLFPALSFTGIARNLLWFILAVIVILPGGYLLSGRINR